MQGGNDVDYPDTDINALATQQMRRFLAPRRAAR